MKAYRSVTDGKTQEDNGRKGRGIMGSITMMLAITIALGVLPALGGANLAVAGADSGSYNNVQVFVHTTDNFVGTYVISAYNSSGWLVTWSQSKYPAASFELPSATYLITVNVFEQYYGCYPYAVAGTASASSAGGAPSPAPAGNAMVMPPCKAYNPKAEYGYSIQQVSSSTTLTVNTQPMSQNTPSKLSVQVSYANGTAASDVSVSSWVVGGSYWWGGANPNDLVMYGQTGRDGTVNLMVPNVPVEVTAWKSVPVNLPKNETTVTTTVAGEKVNVTVYWQPMWVGLGASALVLPPQNSVSMTLHFQQPNYQVIPYGAAAQGGGISSGGSAPIPGTAGGAPLPSPAIQGAPGYSGTPAQGTQGSFTFPQPADRISSFPGTEAAAPVSSTFGGSSLPLLGVALAAVALAAASLAVTLRRRS